MIEIRGLTKRYGKLLALDHIDLSIGEGELFGFIGPNGAGKSTTMKTLSCLLRPDEGSATVKGLDVMRDGDRIRRIIGYMPDFLGVYDDLTVDEYLNFFAAAFGVRGKKRRTTVDGVLELTDLTFKKHAMVSSLSRGMQQRLGVARVLVHDPDVLLLDEPASGLDPRARIEMRELLTELGRMGKTIMISSHILSELAEMCSSIGIIEKGKMLYSGSIEEAYARADAGERVLVKLEDGSPPPEALLERLARAQRVATAEKVDGGIMLSAPTGTAHHALIEAVIEAGARIAAFTPEPRRLEDAFLSLTKGRLN